MVARTQEKRQGKRQEQQHGQCRGQQSRERKIEHRDDDAQPQIHEGRCQQHARLDFRQCCRLGTMQAARQHHRRGGGGIEAAQQRGDGDAAAKGR